MLQTRYHLAGPAGPKGLPRCGLQIRNLKCLVICRMMAVYRLPPGKQSGNFKNIFKQKSRKNE